MHSIWQEQMEFPVYPILKRDKKTDILYVGATLYFEKLYYKTTYSM